MKFNAYFNNWIIVCGEQWFCIVYVCFGLFLYGRKTVKWLSEVRCINRQRCLMNRVRAACWVKLQPYHHFKCCENPTSNGSYWYLVFYLLLLVIVALVSCARQCRKLCEWNHSSLIYCVRCFFAGIILIVNASENYAEELNEDNRGSKPMEMVETAEAIDIGLIVCGILLTLFGFVLVALYIKVAEWRRHCVCPCGLSKKQGLARQLQSGNGGTQLPLNPSTDPLVSHTQYAPVSELPRPDDEECRTFLTDNKDW